LLSLAKGKKLSFWKWKALSRGWKNWVFFFFFYLKLWCFLVWEQWVRHNQENMKLIYKIKRRGEERNMWEEN
jgi:hypothetical protein